MIRVGDIVCSKLDNNISGVVTSIRDGKVFFTCKSKYYGFFEKDLHVISHNLVPDDEVNTVDFIELTDDEWDWMISFIKE